MTIYYYENSPAVDKVRITRSAGGRHTAYLHAADNADPAELERIKHALKHRNMLWTPIKRNGEYVLEVRNIGTSGRNLLTFLHELGALKGLARKSVNPENKITFMDQLKSNTLRLSGLLYTSGDLSFVGYGWKDSFKGGKFTDPENLLTGIFYALGTPILSIFGTGDKSDVQLRYLSADAIKFLQKKGINVPEHSAIRSVTHRHNSSLWKRFIGWCERYPAEICNASYGIAGAILAFGAIRRRKDDKNLRKTIVDVATGVSTVIAGLISVFVEEKPLKEGEKRKKGLAGAWQWVKEKPLRAAGYILGISTVGHAINSVVGYNEARNHFKANGIPLKDAGDIAKNPTKYKYDDKTVDKAKDIDGLPLRGLFVATNLAAEGLMSVSSKGHGQGVESDASLEPSAYAVMSDLVLLTPPEQRHTMLDAVSEYLAQKDVLNLPKDKIREAISTQMQDMKDNPWVGVKRENSVVKEAEAVAEAAMAANTSKWQDNVTNSVSSPAVPSPSI